MTTSHPASEQLQKLVVGDLPDPPASSVEAHLLECPTCQELTSRLDTSDTFVEAIRSGGRLASRADYDSLAGNGMSSARQENGFRAELGELGNYVLLDKIGAGGMGQVYKARHRVMDRIVAIKVLPAAVTKVPAAIERFQREVKAAARLAHPHVVTAYDADQADGVHFLVMEYVAGIDLAALVKKNGPLPVEQALDYTLQAAQGLEYAHKKGVIHRDIKPANLLLDDEGTVKVLDLGLARLAGEMGVEANTQAGLTATGTIMGTVDYMSPEQAFNTKKADARADIYSLGCTLYYLLTGGPLFSGQTVMEKLLAHRDQPIPHLVDTRPGLPGGLQAVLGKMLAKLPQERYQTMGEVIEALASMRESEVRSEQRSRLALPLDPSFSPPSLRRPRLIALALGGVATAILAGVIIIQITRPDGTKMTIEAPDDAIVKIERKGEPAGTTPALPQGAAWNGWPSNAPPAAIAPFSAERARQYQDDWAKHLGVPPEYENSLGMKFRLIPPGEFLMGCTAAEIDEALKLVTPTDQHWKTCVKSAAPQHKVVLTKPFYLGIYEVTQKEYEAVMQTNPSLFAKTSTDKDSVQKVADLETATFPVDSASWNDAVEFCLKLSQREKLKPCYVQAGDAVALIEATGYRLPTEAEWEFACRAGTTTEFWNGQDEKAVILSSWFGRSSGGRTHAVGGLKGNPFGLFDIQGNVAEWVHDWWDPDYYKQFTDRPAIDPRGPSRSLTWRMFRGGCWNGLEPLCAAGYREAHPPDTRSSIHGFRVFLDRGGGASGVESSRG